MSCSRTWAQLRAKTLAVALPCAWCSAVSEDSDRDTTQSESLNCMGTTAGKYSGIGNTLDEVPGNFGGRNKSWDQQAR